MDGGSRGDAGLDGNAGNNSGPSVNKKTVLKALDQAALPDRIAALKLKLATPDNAALSRWISEQQAVLAKELAGTSGGDGLWVLGTIVPWARLQ